MKCPRCTDRGEKKVPDMKSEQKSKTLIVLMCPKCRYVRGTLGK